MTNEQALSLMRKSTSVEQWNENRLQVRHKVSLEQWEGKNRDGLHSIIDASGLIVEVLGADPIFSRSTKNQ